MDMLPSIIYVLWVHEQCLIYLGYNNTHGCCSSDPWSQICGTRFGENCRITMPSLGWCMLFHEEPQAMNVLPLIPHILWVHRQGIICLDIFNTLGSCSYKPPQSTQAEGPDLVWVCCSVANNRPWMDCQAFPVFMGACAMSNQPETQSIYQDPVQQSPQSTQAVGPDLVRTAN